MVTLYPTEMNGQQHLLYWNETLQQALAIHIDPSDPRFQATLDFIAPYNELSLPAMQYACKLRERDLLYDKNRWKGEQVETLTLTDDEGYGDAIQALRYIPLLKNKCSKLQITCRKELHDLIQDSFSGISFVDTYEKYIPFYDLTFIFDPVIPNQIPYLYTKKQISVSQRIGLCWTTQLPSLSYNKKIPNELIAHLLQRKDIISLQQEDIQTTTFGETAAIINNLDLVISGDFVIAHLAGALGKPVWLMLPYPCDNRWKSNPPWYPSMRFFQQTEKDNWKPVIEAITRELNN